jgi:hypothetical protein
MRQNVSLIRLAVPIHKMYLSTHYVPCGSREYHTREYHNREYYKKRMNRLNRIEGILIDHQFRLEKNISRLQDHLHVNANFHDIYILEDELKVVNDKLFDVKDDKFWLNLESKYQ